jgi:hypothetical protein
MPAAPAAPAAEICKNIPYPINDQAAYVFDKHPIICCELSQDEDVVHADSVHKTCTAAVYFYNSVTKKSGLAFFDKNEDIDEREFISLLRSVGITNIDVRWVFMLPQTELSYCLVEHYNIESQEAKEQLETLVKIVKTINPCKEKMVFIKAIFEFIYNNYEFKYGSKITIKDMYNEFKKYNINKFRFAMNTFIDEKAFARLFVYSFFEIEGGCLLNLSKRLEEKTVTLDIEHKLAALLKIPYVVQKTHQLRGEPPCKTNYVGPWGMSSHVEFSGIEDFSKKIL